MRFFVLIAMLCVASTLVACGNDNSLAEPGKLQAVSKEILLEELKVSTASGEPEGAKPIKPRIRPPSGPLPKQMILEDLKEGSGPAAKARDEITIEYLAVDLTGEELYTSWDRREPFLVDLGFGFYFEALEEGLEGMKVGGRRAMIIPANLTEGLGPLIYVVDLLKIE